MVSDICDKVNTSDYIITKSRERENRFLVQFYMFFHSNLFKFLDHNKLDKIVVI